MTKTYLPREDEYCGCCGRLCSEYSLWCRDCSKHTGLVGDLANRTYEARTGSECPFQV